MSATEQTRPVTKIRGSTASHLHSGTRWQKSTGPTVSVIESGETACTEKVEKGFRGPGVGEANRGVGTSMPLGTSRGKLLTSRRKVDGPDQLRKKGVAKKVSGTDRVLEVRGGGPDRNAFGGTRLQLRVE